jgi:hypothetical protein
MAKMGKPKRHIRVEPLPRPRREREPAREPAREPVKEPARREKAPA